MSVFKTAVKRWLLLLLVILALLSIITAFTPNTWSWGASYNTGCASSVHRWKMIANNYFHKQVGTFKARQTRCWGRRGMLTYTHLATEITTTSLGSFVGFRAASDGPYVLQGDRGMVEREQDFSAKGCFVYYSPFCSATAEFSIVAQIMAPAVHHRWIWRFPFCTNKVCADRLTFRLIT